MQEENAMKKFLREGLSSAMNKCLEDSAVTGWPQNTQNDIMAACMQLVELAVVILEVGFAFLRGGGRLEGVGVAALESAAILSEGKNGSLEEDREARPSKSLMSAA